MNIIQNNNDNTIEQPIDESNGLSIEQPIDESNEGDDEGDDEEKELTIDDHFPEEEIDNELREALYNKVCDYDYGSVIKKQDKKKIIKEKVKTKSTLQDIIKKETDTQPKKWASTRVATKTVVVATRQFNPRLPPYLTIEKTKEIKKDISVNTNNFPLLV